MPVPLYEVYETDYGLTFEVPYREFGNRFPDGRNDLDYRDCTYRFELTFPFSTWLETTVQGSNYVQHVIDAASPVSTTQSAIFQIIVEESNASDREELIAGVAAINHEDQRFVESQSPTELPLDLREEIHIPADKLSITYRAALATKFGLGTPDPN